MGLEVTASTHRSTSHFSNVLQRPTAVLAQDIDWLGQNPSYHCKRRAHIMQRA